MTVAQKLKQQNTFSCVAPVFVTERQNLLNNAYDKNLSSQNLNEESMIKTFLYMDVLSSMNFTIPVLYRKRLSEVSVGYGSVYCIIKCNFLLSFSA